MMEEKRRGSHLTVWRGELQCPVHVKTREITGTEEVAIIEGDNVAGIRPVALQDHRHSL